MAITLDATVGGANSNTYCTLAEANTYHEGFPQPDEWLANIDDYRNRALATATRLLDEYMEWEGFVMTETQALLWPRTGALYKNGYFIPDDIIPKELKNAVAEFARQLLVQERTADFDIETQRLTALTAGPVTMKFDQNKIQAKVIPDAVLSMIKHLGTIKSRYAVNVELERA